MPLLATCVLIFHLKLISVQRIMQMRAATIIPTYSGAGVSYTW